MLFENVTVAGGQASATGRQALEALLNRLRAPTVRRDVPPSREYAAALADAKKAGRSAYNVDVQFLPKAGWTVAHERQYLHDVSVIAFGNHKRFFEYGHAPESIEWALELLQ